MANLYHIRPDGSQVECWELGANPLLLGRGDSADAYVEDDALSRSHFLITREGSAFLLLDLNSSNGTWVNDKRIHAHKLLPGDIIAAGESLFFFSDVASSTLVIPGPLPLMKSPELPQPHQRAI